MAPIVSLVGWMVGVTSMIHTYPSAKKKTTKHKKSQPNESKSTANTPIKRTY